MIYIVWTVDIDLQPQLRAFKNKKDAKKFLDECRIFEESEDPSDEIGFRFGMWKIPFASSQSKLCFNISRNCF